MKASHSIVDVRCPRKRSAAGWQPLKRSRSIQCLSYCLPRLPLTKLGRQNGVATCIPSRPVTVLGEASGAGRGGGKSCFEVQRARRPRQAWSCSHRCTSALEACLGRELSPPANGLVARWLTQRGAGANKLPRVPGRLTRTQVTYCYKIGACRRNLPCTEKSSALLSKSRY